MSNNICISVSAGMLAKNINSTYISMSDFIEYRGVSWTMGGVGCIIVTLVNRC